jgi:DNA polymerase I-like protein with 3'-5' exonuclease and polymerase domains
LWAEWARKCPEVHLVTVIHDELLVQIPNDKIEASRKIFEGEVVPGLNQGLKWNTEIRTGWQEGKDFYQAK